MKEIQLTQGKVAQVDDEDFPELNKFKWHAHKDNRSENFYACRKKYVSGRSITVRMHREILGLFGGNKLVGDHKDGNTLNNQRDNLRATTQRLNCYNRHNF